jgi:hypothetical protein
MLGAVEDRALPVQELHRDALAGVDARDLDVEASLDILEHLVEVAVRQRPVLEPHATRLNSSNFGAVGCSCTTMPLQFASTGPKPLSGICSSSFAHLSPLGGSPPRFMGWKPTICGANLVGSPTAYLTCSAAALRIKGTSDDIAFRPLPRLDASRGTVTTDARSRNHGRGE